MDDVKTYSTKDYSKFKSLVGNRFVNRAHVRKLITSLEHKNMLQYHPILVTDKMVVIDGQHRLEAAKALGLEIFYKIVPGANLETVQELNSTMKEWTLKDFCESYAMLGREDYEELLKFSTRHGLSLSFSAQLLQGAIKNQSGTEPNKVRNGTFKVLAQANAEETVRRMKEIQPYADAKSWKDPKFVRALVSLYSRGMDHKRFVEKMRMTGVRLHRQVSYRDYVFEIMDIYNKGNKKDKIELDFDI